MKIFYKQHVLFWICYIVWDILQAVISFSGGEGGLSPEVGKAFYSALIGIIPKVLLAIAILHFFIAPTIARRRITWTGLLKALFFTLLALLLLRTLNYFIVVPWVYEVDNSMVRFFNSSSFLVTFADLVLPVIALVAYVLLVSTLSAREREARLEKEKLKSELNFLKAQIHPHFLFNMLGSIHSLTRIKAPEAADITIKLSKILRFMMFEAGNKQITLAEEVKLLEDYIDLEHLRFRNKLSLAFNKDIEDANRKITPLILLPFVENAFKHGVADSRYESYIRVNIHTSGDNLLFEVTNSTESSKTDKGKKGIGLANIKRQLELLYPAHELNIFQSSASEFSVLLKLNLSENEKTFMSGN